MKPSTNGITRDSQDGARKSRNRQYWTRRLSDSNVVRSILLEECSLRKHWSICDKTKKTKSCRDSSTKTKCYQVRFLSRSKLVVLTTDWWPSFLRSTETSCSQRIHLKTSCRFATSQKKTYANLWKEQGASNKVAKCTSRLRSTWSSKQFTNKDSKNPPHYHVKAKTISHKLSMKASSKATSSTSLETKTCI